MNKKYLIVGLVILIILVIVGIIIYKQSSGIKLDEEDKLELVSYYYMGESIGDIYTYTIYKQDSECFMKVEFMNINEENPDIVKVDDSVLDEIDKLVRKYKANEWNGFNKTDTSVLDGRSFSMELKYSNDKNIMFSGNNIYPDGYIEFEKEFLKLIESAAKTVKDKYDL